jgi:fructokinase
MPSVFAFGETVYDIIFQDNQPVAANAGGAMLNTAVSLGRCGHNVTLLSEIGADPVGRIILDFLEDNGVDTRFIFPYQHSLTPVALAFLDDQKSATYTFFKQYPEKRLEQPFPSPEPGDIVLFGSFYSLVPAIHDQVTGFIRHAREAGALVVYDPNIRKNHLEEVKTLFALVLENISLADIIRGSEEDFDNLLGSRDHEEVFKWVWEQGCHYLVITTAGGAYLLSDHFRLFVKSEEVEVVSTIGAGDSFNAGIIHGLLKQDLGGISLDLLGETEWRRIISSGLDFAATCCGSLDNYISREFGIKAHYFNAEDQADASHRTRMTRIKRPPERH